MTTPAVSVTVFNPPEEKRSKKASGGKELRNERRDELKEAAINFGKKRGQSTSTIVSNPAVFGAFKEVESNPESKNFKFIKSDMLESLNKDYPLKKKAEGSLMVPREQYAVGRLVDALGRGIGKAGKKVLDALDNKERFRDSGDLELREESFQEYVDEINDLVNRTDDTDDLNEIHETLRADYFENYRHLYEDDVNNKLMSMSEAESKIDDIIDKDIPDFTDNIMERKYDSINLARSVREPSLKDIKEMKKNKKRKDDDDVEGSDIPFNEGGKAFKEKEGVEYKTERLLLPGQTQFYDKRTPNQIVTDYKRLQREIERQTKAGKPPTLSGMENLSPNAEGGFQEGGMPVEQDMPVDTYPNIPPEEMAAAEASQLPDNEMEDQYIDFILDESLNPEEQTYLMNSLEADPQLSVIFDKLIGTASEFSGAGEVEGPGTGVSDSIPARLSDGEFVMTRKATDAIGADNLQTMMDDAERAYDGGYMMKAFGGVVEDEELEDSKSTNYQSKTDEEIRKVMIGSNRMPSVR